jgi:hypothetical protein
MAMMDSSGANNLMVTCFAALRRCARGAMLMVVALASPAVAQTDYYNLDKNRPVRIEDAYATERYAFELKLAPLRLERESGGVYHWGIDPEIAYGILPRTHIELGFPFAVIDLGGAGQRAGLAGIELSALHNLNVETRTLPAFGLRGDVLLPVGSLALERVYPAVTGIATRTYRWARFHVNVQYTFGPAPDVEVHPDETATVVTGEEVSRWLAGLAVDRTFPLRALLVIGDVYARQPLHEEDSVEWNAGVGFRYQVNPYLAVDAGVGRRLTGDSAWYVTFGSAFAFGLRPFVPVPRQ